MDDMFGLYVNCHKCGKETLWSDSEMKRDGWKKVDVVMPPVLPNFPEGYCVQTQLCPECVKTTVIEDEWPDVVGEAL